MRFGPLHAALDHFALALEVAQGCAGLELMIADRLHDREPLRDQVDDSGIDIVEAANAVRDETTLEFSQTIGGNYNLKLDYMAMYGGTNPETPSGTVQRHCEPGQRTDPCPE